MNPSRGHGSCPGTDPPGTSSRRCGGGSSARSVCEPSPASASPAEDLLGVRRAGASSRRPRQGSRKFAETSCRKPHCVGGPSARALCVGANRNVPISVPLSGPRHLRTVAQNRLEGNLPAALHLPPPADDTEALARRTYCGDRVPAPQCPQKAIAFWKTAIDRGGIPRRHPDGPGGSQIMVGASPRGLNRPSMRRSRRTSTCWILRGTPRSGRPDGGAHTGPGGRVE